MRILAAGLLCLTLLGAVYGQTSLYSAPVEVPSDPRSIAMGESFTGLPANPAALMYNPAGLAGLKGVSVSYSQRKLNWMENLGLAYHGANIYAQAPFGVFAAQYNRLTLGTFQVTTAASPKVVAVVAPYEHDIALGFGMNIAGGVSGGVAAKYYDIIPLSLGDATGTTTTPAWLFDAGLLFAFPALHEQAALRDNISLGASIQNLGTALKFHATATQFAVEEVSAHWLPQYLRFGICYEFALFPSGDGGFTPVAGVLSAEYRRVVNSGLHLTDERSFWGAGLELTLYELLCLHGGKVGFPFDSIYGKKNSGLFRYGAGITLPLQKLGVRVPLRCTASYTALPLRELGFLGSPQRMLLDTFSFELHLTEGLWQ